MADVFANEVIDVTRYLDEGLCRCEFCQGSYSHELEIVCGECQRALCPFCTTREAASYRCPECEGARARRALPSR